jgi:hypothetical protein
MSSRRYCRIPQQFSVRYIFQGAGGQTPRANSTNEYLHPFAPTRKSPNTQDESPRRRGQIPSPTNNEWTLSRAQMSKCRDRLFLHPKGLNERRAPDGTIQTPRKSPFQQEAKWSPKLEEQRRPGSKRNGQAKSQDNVSPTGAKGEYPTPARDRQARSQDNVSPTREERECPALTRDRGPGAAHSP